MTFSPFGKPPAPASGAINVTSYNQSGGSTRASLRSLTKTSRPGRALSLPQLWVT
jgi:hypothetical protein